MYPDRMTWGEWCGSRAAAPAAIVLLSVALVCLLGAWRAPLAHAASTQPIEMAAPYEYLGWGEPQAPTSVIAAAGVHDLTLAFILSHGKCNPEWDGERPLLGGSDEKAIEAIRAAGGEVDVSFGGWSGKKLGSSCKTPTALASAYQKVIGDYSLGAIDIDIEHGEYTNAKTRERVVQALAIVHGEDPGLEISITFGTEEAGPESDGRSLIADAAAIGFQPNAWTVMPFDFGPARTDMGHASIKAVEGLAQDIVYAYGITAAAAYEHAGISSMNGESDESSETVSIEDFQTMLAFAELHDLARFTFWAVNRDRPCTGGETPGEDCSGISQQPYAFTDVIADY
jgi:chitinase